MSIPFSSPDAPIRKKSLHVLLSDDEHRNLSVVVAHSGLSISDYIRPLIFQHVESELESRGLRPALPRRAASAPAKSPQ